MSASEQIASQYADASLNRKQWGSMGYNAIIEGVIEGGVTDTTAKLQALVNKAISEGRRTIFLPHITNGQYRVTALTNADQVDFIGDNCSFVGGYTGTITQLGIELDLSSISVPKYHDFGGQLAKLKDSLSNPLEQITGIVFIGDSITWGSGLGSQNAPNTPANLTLSDARDNFSSPSYVNNFKRYIGENYAFDSTPVLSNWPTSPTGQAVAEYTQQFKLYPHFGDFTVTSVGASASVDDNANATSITGYQLWFGDGNAAGGSYNSVSFNFTGDTFTLAFWVVAAAQSTYYDLYVDGVKIGTYSCYPGINGFVEGSNNQRTHTFNYVKNKTVEIRSNRNGDLALRYLVIEAIIINKKIRITNQGIVGQNTPTYTSFNLTGGFGNNFAVGPQDGYVFCQLGTNDRGTKPFGVNLFKKNLKAVVDIVTPLANMILLCANPAANEDPTIYGFTMQGTRDVVYRTAKANSIDMIDNYAIFSGTDVNAVTSDGLHPNTLGHQLMSRNVINALEMA